MSLPWGVRTMVIHQMNPVIRSADMIDGGIAHRFKSLIHMLCSPSLFFNQYFMPGL
jgi:hypothetical protein